MKQFRLAIKKGGKKETNYAERMFLGLLSGIANTTGVHVNLIRIIFVCSIFFYGVGIGLYFMLWLLAILLYGYDE